jgi:hypothetical protein
VATVLRKSTWSNSTISNAPLMPVFNSACRRPRKEKNRLSPFIECSTELGQRQKKVDDES